ncbi:MAG TPA: PSD1 and planctomycete cytochrome C domain-containing protein [Pirellulaceae bacterium]|jgi:mono/diheme cytochrome c family protein|nr:PSD1 and planctomycete cytochrome C domain-containing protein [Pirellulaceae bacterium]
MPRLLPEILLRLDGRRPLLTFALGAVLAILFGNVVAAQGQEAEEERSAEQAAVDFGRDIRPLLAKKCLACHGPADQEGGLDFSSRETSLADLDSGEHAIVPGMPGESALLGRVTEEDEFLRMPPEGPALTEEEVDLLRRWIEQGAEWEAHWAFQPRTNPPVPQVQNLDAVASPIDAFLLAKLEPAGLSMNEPADRRTLIRRVTYDLIGLPPSKAEVEAFVADERPDAYARLVDRLLADPRYGERWGRHWLDLVRYAETNSFERDGKKPHVWKYRDYVIDSLNSDKPYDAFVREQLAGDEIAPESHEAQIATGYYMLGLWDDEPADREQARFDGLDDLVAVTGQAFLGLTVNCARCHDHKIDPIPQRDYYQLVAFFQDVPRVGDHRAIVDLSPPDVQEQYRQLDREKREVEKAMREIEQSGIVRMSGEDQRATEGRDRERVLKEKLRDYLDEQAWKEYSELRDRKERLEKTELPPRNEALGIGNPLHDPPPTFVMMRGNPHSPGEEEVSPGFPTLFSAPAPKIERPATDRSSGRRRALAEWIAADDNPLTARVLANRLWQFHFGRGIVRSSNNFGLLGDAPTHPELLDWLAERIVATDWRLKDVHREILLSNAYRMSSASQEEALAKDPRNDLFWRFDMRRLSGEEIRDSILLVSGSLNDRLHGPSVYPKLSKEVLEGQSQFGNGWNLKESQANQNRRSVYAHVKRSLPVPLLAVFDFPETDATCEARFMTTQPQQALELLNGDFAQEQAALLAEKIRQETGDADRDGQIRVLLERVLSREVGAEEVERVSALMDRLKAEHSLPEETAFELACLYALNLNEFVFLD